MRIGVILASHGEFAQAALGAVEMIAGKQPDVIALGLTAEKSLESFESEMREAYETLSAECELVVTLCDIYGGTPFNVTTRCLLNGMNMVAYTGLSMPSSLPLTPGPSRRSRLPLRPWRQTRTIWTSRLVSPSIRVALTRIPRVGASIEQSIRKRY